MLEWLFFISIRTQLLDRWFFGDKDTYELAFALAGKPQDFQKVRGWIRTVLGSRGQVEHMHCAYQCA